MDAGGNLELPVVLVLCDHIPIRLGGVSVVDGADVDAIRLAERGEAIGGDGCEAGEDLGGSGFGGAGGEEENEGEEREMAGHCGPPLPRIVAEAGGTGEKFRRENQLRAPVLSDCEFYGCARTQSH